MQELHRLLDAGYEVAFTKDDGGYWAHVDNDQDPDKGCTAGGETPELALWAASPLHGDDEPMPDDTSIEIIRAVRRSGYNQGVRDGHQQATDERVKALEENMRLLADAIRGGLAKRAEEVGADIRGLSAEMSDVFDRLDTLEGRPCGNAVCYHAKGSHWEIAEPDGERKGCAILGCKCMAYMK